MKISGNPYKAARNPGGPGEQGRHFLQAQAPGIWQEKNLEKGRYRQYGVCGGNQSSSGAPPCPGTICRLRISEELLAWEPERHKTQYRGHELIMYLGPRCQARMGRYLYQAPYCFDPKGQSKNGRAGRCYSVQSYRQAIQRACRRAGLPEWMPHQLRHARGHLVREEMGLEAAQVVLAMPRYRPLRSIRPGRISWPGEQRWS